MAHRSPPTTSRWAGNTVNAALFPPEYEQLFCTRRVARKGGRMARIVVVEDDIDVRDLVVMKLQRSGHHVVAAGDGQAGLELCLRERPDVLVLDVRMPIMSGLEVLHTIRTSLRHVVLRETPVLILSAAVLTHDRREAYEMGADAFLAKPFTPRHLVDLIEQLASG